MFTVRVNDTCRWPVVVVDGQQFSRVPIPLATLSEEIRTSPLLEVSDREEVIHDPDSDNSSDDRRSGRKRAR